jgi:hypothetical protein
MDEKIFEQPKDSQEPSPEQGPEDVEQQRAEIREAETSHPDEREQGSTGSRGSWS